MDELPSACVQLIFNEVLGNLHFLTIFLFFHAMYGRQFLKQKLGTFYVGFFVSCDNMYEIVATQPSEDLLTEAFAVGGGEVSDGAKGMTELERIELQANTLRNNEQTALIESQNAVIEQQQETIREMKSKKCFFFNSK